MLPVSSFIALYLALYRALCSLFVPEVCVRQILVQLRPERLIPLARIHPGPGHRKEPLLTLLALVVVAYYWTRISRVALFWFAFVLTRPLGATLGDLLDKPVRSGGLALSRYAASGAIAAFIVVCILVFPQQPAEGAGHGR